MAKTKHVSAKKSSRPSEKVKRPSLLECIFNKRYTDRSVHYFTTGTGVDKSTARDVTKEPTPFSFPRDTQEFSCKELYKSLTQRFREQESKYDFSTRPNFRSRQNKDILNRLYIPDDDVEDGREPGLLDIDSQYFKIIQGHPIKEKLDIRKYVEEMRETFRTRLKVGYQMDEAMKIEEKFREEQKRLNTIQSMFKLYSDSFDDFLEEDYESAKKLLQDAQEEAEKSARMDCELKQLDIQLGIVKCQLCLLEEKWKNCKMFQKFLYMISPMDWRKKHDYMNRNQDGSVSSVSEISTLVGRHKLSSTESTLSPDESQGLLLTNINRDEEPLLYFTETNELIQVFEEMELQNLSSLQRSEALSDSILTTQRGLDQARQQFETESAFLMGKIKDLETAISWEEDRAQSFKGKAKELLYGLFKDLVVSESVLNLHVFVEDVYETCIAPNDINLGMYDMMREIELKMESLLLTLDYLPFAIVKAAERETYEEGARIMKQAKEAEARVKLMEKLKKRLRRALESPTYRSGKPLKPRSNPPPIKDKKPKPEKPLTEEEKDFLNFFTDYCRHVDNPRDYLPPKID
jgi:hypothetical protein